MVRPREFDEDDVVERAMLVFWRRGYDDCSIADLVDATKVQRQGLYNAFGDKRGLFLAALRAYREGVEASLVPLRRAEAGLPEIRRFIEDTLQRQMDGDFGGCLMIRTALGPGHHDEMVRAAVEAGAASVRACFVQVIRQAKARRDIADAVEPEVLAGLLFTVLHGLSALTRTGGTPGEVSAVLSQILQPPNPRIGPPSDGPLTQPRNTKCRWSICSQPSASC